MSNNSPREQPQIMNTPNPQAGLAPKLELFIEKKGITDIVAEMKKDETKASEEASEAGEAKLGETEAEALARAKKAARNKRKKENAKRNKAEAKAVEVSSPQLNFKIKPSPGKGLGLFVTRDIKKGDVIFTEASLLPDTHGNSWWRKHGSYGVASTERKKRFDALHSYCNCHQTPCMETDFMKIWDVNSFEVWTTAQSTSFRYALVFENASRINHSCLPNARYGFTGEKHMVVRALRNLDSGDEVTFNYIGSSENTEVRRDGLRVKYGFFCDCAACAANRNVSYNEWRLHGGNEFGRPEATVRDMVVINQHTAADRESAKRVGDWLSGLSCRLPHFREAALSTIQRRQKENILDKGLLDVGQENENVALDTLGLWLAMLAKEENNVFGFDAMFFAVALKNRLEIWRRLNEMGLGCDMFKALDNMIYCINGLLQ